MVSRLCPARRPANPLAPYWGLRRPDLHQDGFQQWSKQWLKQWSNQGRSVLAWCLDMQS